MSFHFSTIDVLQPDLGSMADVNATFYDAIANVDAVSPPDRDRLYRLRSTGIAIDFAGTGLTYDGKTGAVTGGTLTSFTLRNQDGRVLVMSFAPASARRPS